MTASADRKSTATTGSARRLARNAERELRALEYQTTELFVSVQRDTSDRLLVNADQNATETSIARDLDQRVIMEFARILATEPAGSVLTVIFAA